MLYVSGNFREVFIGSTIPDGCYRVTVTEALSYLGDATMRDVYERNVGTGSVDFFLNRHHFGLVLPENHGLDDSELLALAKRYCKDFILIEHPIWNSTIYHHSANPNKVIEEGWRLIPERNNIETLSFGPGLYCYYHAYDLMKPDDQNLLVGIYRGTFYTCELSFEGVAHETYGYIPAGYQSINWHKFHSLNADEREYFREQEVSSE